MLPLSKRSEFEELPFQNGLNIEAHTETSRALDVLPVLMGWPPNDGQLSRGGSLLGSRAEKPNAVGSNRMLGCTPLAKSAEPQEPRNPARVFLVRCT